MGEIMKKKLIYKGRGDYYIYLIGENLNDEPLYQLNRFGSMVICEGQASYIKRMYNKRVNYINQKKEIS